MDDYRKNRNHDDTIESYNQRETDREKRWKKAAEKKAAKKKAVKPKKKLDDMDDNQFNSVVDDLISNK